MNVDLLLFIVLLSSLFYQIAIWEIVGALKQKFNLTNPGWFYLRVSGIPILMLCILFAFSREIVKILNSM